MLSSMRRTNPKYFYKKFRKRKKTIKSNISLDDFVHHFKNLLSKDNIIDGPDNDENYFLRIKKLRYVKKKLKNDKTPGYHNILN